MALRIYFRAIGSLVLLLGLGACETLNTGTRTGSARGALGHKGRGAHSSGEAGDGGGGGLDFGLRGNGTARSVASAARAMNGHKDCSRNPKATVKCAQQASRILQKAGVPIRMDHAVNGLVSQLRRLGWKDGKCGPGAVRHTSQRSGKGRHIGVIDSSGRTIHNSGTKVRGCGILGPWNYPSWIARSRCLVPPR